MTKQIREIINGSAVKPRLPSIDTEAVEEIGPTHWIDKSIGRRYVNCTLDGYKIWNEKQALAVQQCRDYVLNFGEHFRAGTSLVFIGPKGTGKDHLMVATIKAICAGYENKSNRQRAIYRDGLRLFAEFRGTINNNRAEDSVVDVYIQPDLLALSDPVPPVGSLSEYEQRMLLRVIDGRYRECRPMTATINASKRAEMETRMGPQSTDRLLDIAVVVKCNWESYRQGRDKQA